MQRARTTGTRATARTSGAAGSTRTSGAARTPGRTKKTPQPPRQSRPGSNGSRAEAPSPDSGTGAHRAVVEALTPGTPDPLPGALGAMAEGHGEHYGPSPAAEATLGEVLGASGVPIGILGSMAGAPATRDDLVAALSLLPKPPPLPTEAGAVLAVVGEAARASVLAAEIAAETGCSPHEVVLATTDPAAIERLGPERTLSSAASAAESREDMSKRPAHNVVAIDAPLTRGRRAWVRHMLAALDPSLVVGVVEASTKPEDICAWALDMGGVDALAVEGTSFTCTPASVIACGLPIALIDGQPATPERWAALIEERTGHVQPGSVLSLPAASRRSS